LTLKFQRVYWQRKSLIIKSNLSISSYFIRLAYTKKIEVSIENGYCSSDN